MEAPPANPASFAAGTLADAFSEFIATSARLERSYRALQQQVQTLNGELTERNAELSASVLAEERMRHALESMVRCMPSGVLVVNAQGRVSTINAEACRLLGMTPMFGQGATLAKVSAHAALPLEELARNVDAADGPHELATPDGRWIEVRCSRQPVLQQTILILSDITAQKRAERERDAGRHAFAMAQVATVLAHEMRNPLASMELFAELIESDEERRAEWVANLRAGIRTLSGTVNNVLCFHEGTRSTAVTLTPLRLADVVTGALHFMRPLAEQAGVALHWSNGDCELQIEGNESALRQVLLNLISNALRHTPAGGAISFSMMLRPDADGRGACVQLMCVDTGMGIPDEQLGRIFEAGFSGSGDSAGLGLAVCQRLLQQHHASIMASHRPDGGACFRMEFPALLCLQEAR